MPSKSETRTNPSFVLRGIKDTVFEERPIPQLGPEDVLVEVKSTGICGSDVHYHQQGRIGDYVLEAPMCLGHESAGYVHAVGSAVTRVRPGQAVAMEPGATCGKCLFCKAGKYNLCPRVDFAATPPSIYGTLCRYYRLPQDLVYLLPASCSTDDGAMIEPLAVGIHSVAKLGNLKPGQNIIVFGAGPVGLLCMATAKALGASTIFAVDINEERLAFAKSYAATNTFLPPAREQGESAVDFSTRAAHMMREQLNKDSSSDIQFHLVVEATGVASCVQMGLHMVMPGGSFVQVGMGAPNVELPLYLIVGKEIAFHGSFRYGPGDYPMAISLVGQGSIDLKPLVTHHFDFEDAAEAFEVARLGKDKDDKPVIKCIIRGPE